MKIGKPPSPPERGPGSPPASAARPSKSPAVGLHLDRGRMVQAKVLANQGNGLVTIETATTVLTAKTLVPLTTGQTVWLQVVQSGDPPLLRLAHQAGYFPALLQKLALAQSGQPAIFSLLDRLAGLSDDAVFRQAVADLRLQFELLAPTAKPDLQQLLRCCMLFVHGPQSTTAANETLLYTLRQTLTLFRKKFPTGSADPAGDIKRLEDLYALLELIQTVNQDQETTPFYIFPAFFQGDMGQGQWFLHQEKATPSGTEQATLMDFFLQLSALGETHLQVRLRPGTLAGTFALADPQAADYLQTKLAELNDIFRQQGLEATFSCRHAPGSQLETMLQFCQARLASAPLHLVDVTA